MSIEQVGSVLTAAGQQAHAVLHCNLNTVDVRSAERFYVDGLGLARRMCSVSTGTDATAMGLGEDTESVTSFVYDGRGPRSAPALELVGWSRPATRPGAAVGPLAAIGFRTGDLGAALQRLHTATGLGEPPRSEVVVRGRPVPAVVLTDPDGVTVELVEWPAAPDEPDVVFSHERISCSDVDRTERWFATIGFTRCGQLDGMVSISLPEDPAFTLELTPATSPSARPVADDQGLFRMALAVEDVNASHAALERAGTRPPAPVFFPMPDTPTGGFTALFLTDPDGVVVELVDRPRSSVRRPPALD